MSAATLVPTSRYARPVAEAGVLNTTTVAFDTPYIPNFDAADNWNYPFDNYFRCVSLRNSSAPLHYGDFSLISTVGDYNVLNSWTFDRPPNLEQGYCRPGQVRLDAHEVLVTSRGRLYFHKGGQGYAQGRVPYGHLWIGDIASGTAPSPQVPTSQPPEYGAPSKIPGTNSWDSTRRNGRGCTPTGTNYRMHITRQGTPEEIPAAWQYKPNETSARYNKYADAGTEQSSGTQHYAYLVWSWMHKGDGVTINPGGGMVRSLIKEGQPFYRCDVNSINSVAYASGSTRVVGSVRVIYGKTRTSADGPWVYGWTIHSHRSRLTDGSNGPWTYHLTTCPSSGC
jgi:hypothetical protein